MEMRDELETSNLFNLFLEKTGGTDPANFRGARLQDIAIVEDIVQADIFLYVIDIANGSMIGELEMRSIGKHSNTVRLFRSNSHICHVSDINSLFTAYRCPSRDQFIGRAQHLEQHLTTCNKKVKHVFPKNVYQLRETLFDKLDSFNIPHSDDQKLFKNISIFDFESICVQADKFRDTDATTWIGKHVPSANICINFVKLD